LRFTTSGLEKSIGLVGPQPVAFGTQGLFIQFNQTPSVNDTWTVTIPNTSSANYTANQNAYQAALSNQSTQVSVAQSQVNSAQAALAQAQANLAQTTSQATSADVDAAKAMVQQAQAEVQNAQISLDHATIVAPFSGLARNVTAKPGMVVSSGLPVLSIISNGPMKFDAYASQTDVPNVQTGATVNVTLDAYGDSVKFPAKVSAVDTSETIVNGSPAYHVTLYFTQADSRISGGMTGNALVVTAEHDNVVEIPSRLVLGGDNHQFVLISAAGKNAMQPVTVGLTGDDGMVEIVSGLTAGQTISDF
jgi:RND family efflux transporter MFP subunit